MSLKASDLARMLNEHIGKYGDSEVLIYDGYENCYKTFNENKISRTHGNRFVIECENEND